MKKLFIDLEICSKCEKCSASCGYFYHPQNNGISSLREYATFVTICRHCEDAPCVSSCYHNALERAEDGHIKRYKMRCTSCKSCSLACPFGIVMEDFIPYLDSKCDYCTGLSGKLPKCVVSCPQKAIEVKEIQEKPQENIYFIGEHLAVHTTRWAKDDPQPKRK